MFQLFSYISAPLPSILPNNTHCDQVHWMLLQRGVHHRNITRDTIFFCRENWRLKDVKNTLEPPCIESVLCVVKQF